MPEIHNTADYRAIYGTEGYRTSIIPLPLGAGVANPSIQLTSGVADTWGAYAQIIALCPVNTKIIGVELHTPSILAAFTVAIAKGAAAAEADICTLKLTNIAAAPVGSRYYDYSKSPFDLPNAIRLAARCQDTVGAGTIWITLFTALGVAGRSSLGAP